MINQLASFKYGMDGCMKATTTHMLQSQLSEKNLLYKAQFNQSVWIRNTKGANVHVYSAYVVYNPTPKQLWEYCGNNMDQACILVYF